MKVGDRVRVKSLEAIDSIGEMDECGDYFMPDDEYFVSYMQIYCGKEAIISKVDTDGTIYLDFEKQELHWSSSMLELLD